MKKWTKALIIASSIILALGSASFGTAYFLFLHRYHGKMIDNPFDSSVPFDISKVKTIEKEKGKDFVILNLADVQMCDLEDIKYMPKIKQEIKELIDHTHPNLITLTGDQTWSNENLISLTSLVSWLDEFKIPYAPVFGNHDFGNGDNNAVYDDLKCCEVYEKGKYSLFDRGPSNLDCYGNYVINIKEENKIVRTLYMLDYGVNDYFSDKQIEWFDYMAKGIKKYNNDVAPLGMTFFHKPISQFFSAWLNSPDKYKKLLEEDNEDYLYETAKNNNVKDMVCGHNHWIHFIATNEDDIRFTMALKTGELGGYAKGETMYLNGATYFTLNDEGLKVDDYYVDYDTYHLGKE